jgi:hypothetical protein
VDDGELRARGYQTVGEPGQEDFGWFFNLEIAGTKHNVVIGYRPELDHSQSEWICWIERTAGLIATAFGRRKHIAPEAADAIYGVLSSSSQISDVRVCSKQEL